MKLNTKYKHKALFDMTSATDIIFMLLIFCMLSFSAGSQDALHVNLPTSNTHESSDSHISIVITSERQLLIDNAPIEFKDLKKTLMDRMVKDTSVLMIYADKSVSIENVVSIADIASSLGLEVGIATRTE